MSYSSLVIQDGIAYINNTLNPRNTSPYNQSERMKSISISPEDNVSMEGKEILFSGLVKVGYDKLKEYKKLVKYVK
jgi:hypothetical protein